MAPHKAYLQVTEPRGGILLTEKYKLLNEYNIIKVEGEIMLSCE